MLFGLLATISLVAAEALAEGHDSSVSSTGCDELHKPDTNFTYDREKNSDGKYPHDTQVTVYCPENTVLYGNGQSTCTVNAWVPLAGLCLSACYNRDLLTKQGFERLYEGDNDGWTRNGSYVKAICPTTKDLAQDGACNNRDLLTKQGFERLYEGDNDGWTGHRDSVKAVCPTTKDLAQKGKNLVHLRTCVNGKWDPDYKCSEKVTEQILFLVDGF